MIKNWSLFLITLVAVASLSACGKKSSSSNDNNNCDGNNYYTNPNCSYQQPQYSPPNINWNNQPTTYIPSGNCGQYQQMPSTCYGTYNGYSYCGNLWYYQYAGIVWAFPSGNSGCGGSSTYYNDTTWWNSYTSNSNNSSSNHDDDDDDDNSHSSYNSGWKKVWGIMGDSENRYIVVTVPSTATYYISFKGDYSGKKQCNEDLKVKFDGGNSHKINDLEQTKSSGETTKSCKVNVNFKLKGNKSYKIYLSGKDDSVNNTYLRITDYWPSDISKLCD